MPFFNNTYNLLQYTSEISYLKPEITSMTATYDDVNAMVNVMLNVKGKAYGIALTPEDKVPYPV